MDNNKPENCIKPGFHNVELPKVWDNNIIDKRTKGILFLAGNKSYAPQIVANNGEEFQHNMNTVCAPYGNNDEERIANAERIVKSWNEYDKLKEDNKMLLEALKGLVQDIEHYSKVGIMPSSTAINNAKKAIKQSEQS